MRSRRSVSSSGAARHHHQETDHASLEGYDRGRAAIASMTAGCTEYYRVTDPASGRKYYTDDVNLEWLPAFDGPFRDYNLNLDAGLRTAIFQGFFAEAKIEYRYDSIPARGAEKEDVRYLLGVGWSF